MACSGAYAAAWQYAAFFCRGNLIIGVDDSGLAAQAVLTDSHADFVKGGVVANVGMVAYNLTEDTNGLITARSTHTVTATGVTWSDGDSYRIVTIDAEDIASINLHLEITAGDIHVALAATGACDCTLSDWGSNYLIKLNVFDAAAMFTCRCSGIDNDTRERLLEWVSVQLENLRTGKTDVCSGATGSEFPVVTWAEQSVTEFAGDRIIINDIIKNL